MTHHPQEPKKRGLFDWLDYRWPTILRYGGFLLIAAEGIAFQFSHPSVVILAGGMMGLKDVVTLRDKKNGAPPA